MVAYDPASVFLASYTATIALQTLIHYPEQLRFFRSEPSRVYGAPPRLLGFIELPFRNELLFKGAGVVFVLALVAAACGVEARFSLVAALAGYFLYFLPILPFGYIQRKTNLIPIVLAALIVSPERALEVVPLALSMVYLSAGFEKLRTAGIRWADGQSLRAYLLEHYLYSERPQALWLARRPGLCRWMSTCVLIWELSFWLILLVPALTWIYVLFGLGFHVSASITFRIHFWIYFCPAYLAFLAPWLCSRI
jgi:hypothetical protein